MEEQDHFTSSLEYFVATTSSATTSTSQVQIDGEDNIEQFPPVHDDSEGSQGIFDSWACIITVLAFLFVISMTLIFGVYGFVNVKLGPSSSILIKPNQLFVDLIKVKLSIGIKALLYNTRSAYYKRMPFHGQCTMELVFVVQMLLFLPLLIRNLPQGMASGYWNVKLSYGPRWVTCFVSTFGMNILVLLVHHILNRLPCTGQDERRDEFGSIVSQRMPPLLLQKDEDLPSLGSSYDSISEDEQYAEDGRSGISRDAKQDIDREFGSNVQCLCVICFDAPGECFFLPCEHCVACFACVTRISEATKSCPICHRRVKKARKIFMNDKLKVDCLATRP
ncbi:unnamed protein product [Fraxinus pennsylvanica]|uniref:RING-type domain-containing protein n=1 Tax=Fraxinus pennsylvanica TaxID=56036 RepID=A0AAD1ZS30_9LAMI|nr:unnamed protein product [Fraxinus pennsylvanica]